jgi:polysaccharide export outer membrane protein
LIMCFRNLALIGILCLVSSVARAQQANASPQPGGYALAPGDVIRIAIWREPDLSGEFLVDEQGVVTLPLLGKRSVLNVPVAALRDSLIADYAVQLRNPSVTITPLRRIYVLGEVTKPGLYTVDPTISLAGAVALAGGATPNGNLDRLRVVRNGQVVLNGVAAGSSLSAVDIRSEDQVFVDRRGWLDRNSTFAASALVSTAALIISVLLR